MNPETTVNQPELNAIIRTMQNASDDKIKQDTRFNQLAADIVKKGVEDKITKKLSNK